MSSRAFISSVAALALALAAFGIWAATQSTRTEMTQGVPIVTRHGPTAEVHQAARPPAVKVGKPSPAQISSFATLRNRYFSTDSGELPSSAQLNSQLHPAPGTVITRYSPQTYVVCTRNQYGWLCLAGTELSPRQAKKQAIHGGSSPTPPAPTSQPAVPGSEWFEAANLQAAIAGAGGAADPQQIQSGGELGAGS